jgi:hypothetical protein
MRAWALHSTTLRWLIDMLLAQSGTGFSSLRERRSAAARFRVKDKIVALQLMAASLGWSPQTYEMAWYFRKAGRSSRTQWEICVAIDVQGFLRFVLFHMLGEYLCRYNSKCC